MSAQTEQRYIIRPMIYSRHPQITNCLTHFATIKEQNIQKIFFLATRFLLTMVIVTKLEISTLQYWQITLSMTAHLSKSFSLNKAEDSRIAALQYNQRLHSQNWTVCIDIANAPIKRLVPNIGFNFLDSTPIFSTLYTIRKKIKLTNIYLLVPSNCVEYCFVNSNRQQTCWCLCQQNFLLKFYRDD